MINGNTRKKKEISKWFIYLFIYYYLNIESQRT